MPDVSFSPGTVRRHHQPGADHLDVGQDLALFSVRREVALIGLIGPDLFHVSQFDDVLHVEVAGVEFA